MINPNTKVVPIDHGWANMKTEQDVFTSGVSEITTEPALFNDVLEYNNKYYKIGGKRLEVKEDKVHDDNYYLLTLAATAMTLERLHIRDAHVLWAVGLPLTRFGEEKDDFIKYLMRNKEVTFKYNKIKYHIVVEKVSVYPQCYAAVSDDISPKKTDWKDMGDGLYRSTDKFVRTKSGTVKDIKYSISGAPSGLTVGEIKTDSSQIDDEADLKKYDICVAQTDASNASSNFYLYCNEEAMKKIVDNKSTIKIVAKAYSDEKGGRKWTPSVISQQKITFLEDFTPVTAQATVKVTSNFNEGSFSLYKSDKFTHNAVPGARYYLYEDKDCTELLCKLSKTDDKGLSSSGKVILTQDMYYLKEVLEPDGYQRDNEVYEIPLSYFTLYDKDGKVIQQGKRKDVEEVPETIGVFVNSTVSGNDESFKKCSNN